MNTNNQLATILVSSRKGNLSFPKGKREKGESDLECAFRELAEETGITREQVELLDGVVINENSDKGNPSVRYFVGHLRLAKDEQAQDLVFQYDHEELTGVSWYLANEIAGLEKLKQARKTVFSQVLKIREIAGRTT